MYKSFEMQQTEQVTVLRINGAKVRGRLELDELSDELDQFSKQQQNEKVIVSFHELDWATSEVINALIKLRGEIVAAGGSIRLCAMKTMVRDSFRLLNLDGTLFSIDDTEDEAFEASCLTD